MSWPAGATATTVKVTPTQLADLKSGIASPGYTGPAQVIGLPQKDANPAGPPAAAVTYRVDTKAENGATGSFTVTFTAGEAPAPEPILSPATRDHYLISSLREEAITSAQLEGELRRREYPSRPGS